MFHPRHQLRTALALLLALVLAGCGGGGSAFDEAVETFRGSATDVGPDALVITTTAIPSGKPGVAYPETPLGVQGAQDVTWRVAAGTLPTGIYLTPDGRLLGTPADEGIYEFTAQATGATGSAERDLVLAVGAFGLTATDGLFFGEAWTGRPVTLRSVGQEGAVEFDVLANRTGGRFDAIDPTAGTARWIPGATPGTDILTVRDAGTAATAELDLHVADDPTDTHEARFGSSDPWFLDWSAKAGVHPFATDVQMAMASLGLRSPTGYGAGVREVDRLAELVLKVEILRHINPLFLRNPDGTPRADSLAISFAFERPGAGYVSPVGGTFFSGRANAYSVMALCDQNGTLGAMGMAFGDSIGNANHEHNAPGGSYGQLGVFVNYVAEAVRNNYRLYGSELRDAPVNGGDMEALKAILHGRESPGGRYDLVRYQLQALARSIAYVAAHEIGHSLGLDHVAKYVPGAIMNAVALIGPGLDHAFTPENVDILRLGLPGPARTSLQALKVTGGVAATAALAPGGMHVCGTCPR